MKKSILAILFAGLTSIAHANNVPSSTVEFVNNTNQPVHIENNIAVGDMIHGCNLGKCFKVIDSFDVMPYSSKEVALQTAVTEPNIVHGGMGFTIKTSANGDTNRVVLPVAATPDSITTLASTGFGVGSRTPEVAISYSEKMPTFVVAIAQQVAKNSYEAKVIVSIYPTKL